MNFHGGNIYDYNEKIIDFSSNINPYGASKKLKCEIFKRFDEVSRYPDINYERLKYNISNYLNVYKNDILLGNGAVDIIYNCVKAINYESVYIMAPAFSEYRMAAEQSNKKYNEIVAFDFSNGKFDLKYFCNNVSNNSIVIICNPNNPTGYAICNDEIFEFCSYMKNKNCFVIIDEVFMEFTFNDDKYSMIKYYDEFDNVIIIRAVTKFFGIPGIRLGYGVCSNDSVRENIEYYYKPWDINTFAVISSDIIFNDKNYITLSYKWIQKEKEFLYNNLCKLKSLNIYNTYCNFFLIEFYDLDNNTVQNILLKYNILIRKHYGFSGISEKFIRIAIKDRQSNLELVRALRREF